MSVVERAEIAQEDLVDLFEKKLTAVRIPLYYNVESAAKIAECLQGSNLHGKYENAPEIGRVGQAFYESQANPAAAMRYERDAVRWIKDLRAGLFPQLTPIDRVRLELDEAWPCGARVGVLNGRKMFVGLARTFGAGSHAEPHQDIFAWDAPVSKEAGRVRTQIAMNVYLTMPEDGGELTLWPVSYTREEYEDRRNEGSYGLKRDLLPNPTITLKPRVGELILFNATNVHAVEPIHAGCRVTWSCFIGFESQESPLVMWS